jgi:hypothetical protein
MRSVALALVISTLAAGSALADIRIELRAQVQASCGVVDIDAPVGGDLSRLQLTTVCNSEQFNIVLMGPDGPIEVVSATSDQASVSAGSNQMAVMLRAPGAQTFDVQLADELASAEGLSIQIVAMG